MLTNYKRIFLLEPNNSRKTKILYVPLVENEKIDMVKIHGLGLLVKTSNNRILMSALKFSESSFIEPWYEKSFDMKLKAYVDDKDPLELSELTIPLESGDKIKSIDINTQHGFVLTEKGNLLLFGLNKFGALGRSEEVFTNKLNLSFLRKGESINQVFVGNGHTFLSTTLQRIFTFGRNNSGQLGLGTKSYQFEPKEITKSFKG